MIIVLSSFEKFKNSESFKKVKKFLKKVIKGAIIAIVVFVTVSMVITVIVYDTTFSRYDSKNNAARDEAVAEIVKEIADFTKHTYSSGENTLSGKLYKCGEKSAPLVVVVPGFHAETDDYKAWAKGFGEMGFDAFLFDSTGHGESEGDSSIGFPQIINDLNATLDYIKDKEEYKDVVLFGHSRGGYAACCVVNQRRDISAVASISGVNSAMDAVIASSVKAVGKLAYGNYPFLKAYQSMLFGEEMANMSASDEIAESKIPVIVIQGKNDTDFPPEDFSIYSYGIKNDAKNDKVEYVLYENPSFDGHTSILFDDKGNANPEILKKVASFFKDKLNRE